MSHTPPPRTSSRASIRTLNKMLPSPLPAPPIIRPSSSLSNLHIHSQNSGNSTITPPEVPPMPQHAALDSSASSVLDMDMHEGILLRDTDPEKDLTDGGETIITSTDEDDGSKKRLRDHLRKTLSHRQSKSDIATARPRREGGAGSHLHETMLGAATRYPPREYFVLTEAGKPVFVSRPGGEDSDNMTSVIGIMQALISVFIDDGDRIRCINAGRTHINFLLRPPLYYVCSSSWGEPESVTRSHLDYLHLQIISIVTAGQLRRIFERRTNFDLRRLLNGAESFLVSLLDRIEYDFAMTTSSLHCLMVEAGLRKRAADVLLPTTKIKDILYILLIANGRVITLIRPRKHSIHPADIHIILNTIHSPSILHSPASTSWIPVCLPKYNPNNFVNAYISFLRTEDTDTTGEHSTASSNSNEDVITPTIPFQSIQTQEHGDSDAVLVCISGGGEFDSVREWCDTATKKLESDGILSDIRKALHSGQTEYSVATLGIPGLRHFVYKSRGLVQITAPTFEDPYDSVQAKRRIITLYQTLHDGIHARSGQTGTLKLQYIRTETESVMGWITQPFELYIALSPLLPKTAAVGAANAVVRWVKKEESSLFLKDSPTF